MKIAIQGIKYDQKSSYLPGARLAPPLIRDALHSESSNSYSENIIPVEELNVDDKGDFEIEDYFTIEEITRQHLNEHEKILTLGGDHSITYPIIRAYAQKYQTFDILQIDAHADLYDSFQGDRYSHACPFARIMEDKLCNRLIQVGVRTLTRHQRDQAQKFNVEIITMQNLDAFPTIAFKNPLYLSLDLDALDPAFAPGVSHYEPGGLTTRELLKILQGLQVPIIGADIVEYNPTRDHHNMTAFLAAKAMKEILVKM